MVREQIIIQVGQAGNQISNQFWSKIIQEHSINSQGIYHGEDYYELERINVYFNEGICNRYIPRTVLTDLEPSTLDSIRNGVNGELFQPSNFVFGNSGASNNFACGFYSKGAELVDVVINNIRNEAEKCDCLQGFQMIHSLGGGTGSGMGSLIISKIREEYPDRVISTFSVIPSPKVSDTVVEPYNAILCLQQLIDNADQVFTFDNEALYNICNQKLNIKTPSYGDLNYLISSTLCNISSTIRFKGEINSDPRKIMTNLVPFKRLKFYTMSYSPLNSYKNLVFSYQNQSVPEIFQQLFDPKNIMSHADNRRGKYFTCATIFRGISSLFEINTQFHLLKNKNLSNFIEFIPENMMINLIDITEKHLKYSATCIINSTSIQEVWRRLSNQFEKMFKRKAFLHWYLGEGMEETDFIEGLKSINDLICEYQQYEDMVSYEEDSYIDDDEVKFEEDIYKKI